MDNHEVPDHYLTVEGRLASFHSTHPVPRRRSNAKGKAPKAITWPHKRLDPASFASAGFYFEPSAESPDNVACFLCGKSLDGWTDDDDPAEEHVRHSPHCGWAIVAAIEAKVGDYPSLDPAHPTMMEARKATFAARWPHEGKKTWKCKIEQMVEAGWKYTPTIDSDDMATCTYCGLALDGWEPEDEPMNEHCNRSPDCPFFIMIEQYKTAAPAKKTARGKGARTSKASRLSSQSVATFASEAPSLLADHDDSAMTTTSVATTGGTKRGRAKKATTATAKGKKTRTRKDEPVEVLADPPEEELPPPPPKPTRGRKRASDAVEDSGLTNAEAPAPKKRTARTRRSNTADTSVVEPQPDVSMVDVAQPAPAKTTRKGRASSARPTRKVSAMSSAAMPVAPEPIVDDEELDRQLLADLDRPLSDDELMADSDSERPKAPAAQDKGKKTMERKVSGTSFQEANERSMFEPPAPVDSADVSADLSALRMEMEAEQTGAVQALEKGRKAGSRKAPKETKQTKTVQAVAEPAPKVETQPQSQMPARLSDPYDDDVDELSMMSNATVVKTSTAPAPKKRGRPKKNSTQSQPEPDASQSQAVAAEIDEPAPAPKKRGRPKKNSNQSQVDPDASQSEAVATVAPKKRGRPKKNSSESQPDPDSSQSEAAAAEIVKDSPEPPAAAPSPPPAKKELPAIFANKVELEPPTTPKASTSPAPATRQPVASPSQSPQASDAENQPPSSRPSHTADSSRIRNDSVEPAAEEITTPVRSLSPSKRNGGTLPRRPRGPETAHPWAPLDLDLVFEELEGENAAGAGSCALDAEGARLSSPEKRMTVEEWIYHNAGLAESRLQRECEAMVSRFETEGGRAMRALEGLVVAE